MIELALYSTSGCHLCEDAEALLAAAARKLPGLHWRAVDIADDDGLLERYGVRIPVIRRLGDGAELGWPFDLDTLTRFLAGL